MREIGMVAGVMLSVCLSVASANPLAIPNPVQAQNIDEAQLKLSCTSKDMCGSKRTADLHDLARCVPNARLAVATA